MENILDKLFFNKTTHKLFWCFFSFVKYIDIKKNPAPELHKCSICQKEKIVYNNY